MPCAVGIDLGATKIAAALVDVDSGRALQELTRPTEIMRGGQAVLDECVRIARQLAQDESDAVGIAICELVDRGGEVRSAETLDWREVDIEAAFAPLHVTVESDVRAAGRAEALFGAGRECQEFLYLSVGSGISYCLVSEGEPRPGAHGSAIIVGAPPVEQVASGLAIARASGVARAEEALNNVAHEEVVRRAADELGVALAVLVNALDPELIVVGGGLGLEERYRRLFSRAAQAAMFAEPSEQPAIVPAGLGQRSGVIGAALAARDGRSPRFRESFAARDRS
jgi:glucokinase